MNNKAKAALYTMMSVGSGSVLDCFAKVLSEKFPVKEILAGRFFFAFLMMLPLLFSMKYRQNFKTKRLGVHFLRGGIFAAGLILWVMGLKTTMIATAILISFVAYLFLIVLAYIFLKEKVSPKVWLTSLISFGSLFFIIDFNELSWTSGTGILLLSALFFAFSDIFNKKFANNETETSMTFYSNLFAFLILLVPVLKDFVMPDVKDLALMFCMGVGSNLVLLFILKAYTLADANFIAPFKFFEFATGLAAGFVAFREIPPLSNYFSLAVILICNFYLIFSERTTKKE